VLLLCESLAARRVLRPFPTRRSSDLGHQGVQRLVRDLNRFYRAALALWEQDTRPEGFRWIDADDAQGNTFSFVRYAKDGSAVARSEEHTSELQSRENLVCRLLLEKKK